MAVEPPPPFLRSRSRLPHLSDACAHPSAARSRASCVASGRDGRAPHVQGRWVGWVDDAGRACGRLQRCVHRRGPLESHWLDDGLLTVCSGRLTAGRCRSVVCVGAAPPLWCALHTTGRVLVRHARRAAQRAATAALAALATSSSTPPTLAARCTVVCMCADRHV